MKRTIFAFFATLLLATPALAHDPKLHKGPKVQGKVVSIKGDRLEVGTSGGVAAVTLSPETHFERGMEGGKASKGDLEVGQEVMVSGHKLGSGEFAAAEVMIHEDGRDRPMPQAGDAAEPKPHTHASDGADDE